MAFSSPSQGGALFTEMPPRYFSGPIKPGYVHMPSGKEG